MVSRLEIIHPGRKVERESAPATPPSRVTPERTPLGCALPEIKFTVPAVLLLLLGGAAFLSQCKGNDPTPAPEAAKLAEPTVDCSRITTHFVVDRNGKVLSSTQDQVIVQVPEGKVVHK